MMGQRVLYEGENRILSHASLTVSLGPGPCPALAAKVMAEWGRTARMQQPIRHNKSDIRFIQASEIDNEPFIHRFIDR
jgi:hypothetical protein